MKIQSLIIGAIGMLSSAFVWAQNGEAADAINQSANATIGEWTNVPAQIKGGEEGIATLVQEDTTSLPAGTLEYYINHMENDALIPGYNFEVQANSNGTCKVNGADKITLDGNGEGPVTYEVNTQSTLVDSTLNCTVDIVFIKDNPVIPKLNLEHVTQLNLGKGIEIRDFKFFNVYIANKGNILHLAVIARNVSTPENSGAYIYEVTGEGKDIKLNQIQFIQARSTNDFPQRLAFFAGDHNDTNQYLLIGNYGTSAADSSKIAIYKWGSISFNFLRDQKTGVSVLNGMYMYQNAEGEDILVISNGGELYKGFNQALYSYKHKGEGIFEEKIEDINTANGSGLTKHTSETGVNYKGWYEHTTNSSYVHHYRVDVPNERLTITSDNGFKASVETCNNAQGSGVQSRRDDNYYWAYFNIEDTDYFLTPNTCAVGDNALILSKLYTPVNNTLEAADLIEFGSGDRPVANWTTLKIGESLPYFLAGYAGHVGNASDNAAIIYGWCDQNEGNDATREWCNNSSYDGNIRPYLREGDVPLPDGVTSFYTRRWDTLQIGDNNYLVRIAGYSADNTVQLQMLAVNEE